MSTLTTSQGVCWEIITINERAAYQAGEFMVFWNPRIKQHVLVNGFARVIMTGLVQDCLDSVSSAKGRLHIRHAAAVA